MCNKLKNRKIGRYDFSQLSGIDYKISEQIWNCLIKQKILNENGEIIKEIQPDIEINLDGNVIIKKREIIGYLYGSYKNKWWAFGIYLIITLVIGTFSMLVTQKFMSETGFLFYLGVFFISFVLSYQIDSFWPFTIKLMNAFIERIKRSK